MREWRKVSLVVEDLGMKSSNVRWNQEPVISVSDVRIEHCGKRMLL